MGKFQYDKTTSGRSYINFEDRNESKCTLKESNDAGETVLLGIDNPRPMIHVDYAMKLNVETSEKIGMIPYPLPKEVSLNSWMKLNKEEAKKIGQALIRFSEGGSL